MKVLVLLAYYNRPQMVRNALDSLTESTYQDFEVAVIDDGSDVSIEPILQYYDFRWHYYQTGDTLAQKLSQGGSRHGSFMNQAMIDHPSDLVLTLCDDDALVSTYLQQAVRYFETHPKEHYAYSHVKIYDPSQESPGPTLPMRPYFTNVTGPQYLSCRVDSSQVVWRSTIQFEFGVYFPERQTKDLDASFFAAIGDSCGPANFMECVGQYKGIFSDQMGQRLQTYKVTVE